MKSLELCYTMLSRTKKAGSVSAKLSLPGPSPWHLDKFLPDSRCLMKATLTWKWDWGPPRSKTQSIKHSWYSNHDGRKTPEFIGLKNRVPCPGSMANAETQIGLSVSPFLLLSIVFVNSLSLHWPTQAKTWNLLNSFHVYGVLPACVSMHHLWTCGG